MGGGEGTWGREGQMWLRWGGQESSSVATQVEYFPNIRGRRAGECLFFFFFCPTCLTRLLLSCLKKTRRQPAPEAAQITRKKITTRRLGEKKKKAKAKKTCCCSREMSTSRPSVSPRCSETSLFCQQGARVSTCGLLLIEIAKSCTTNVGRCLRSISEHTPSGIASGNGFACVVRWFRFVTGSDAKA